MKSSHDPRYCRTHAFVAQLFAAHPRHASHADLWNDIARSWQHLAALKEQVERSRQRSWFHPARAEYDAGDHQGAAESRR
jgi:hypothetical protein